MQMQISSEDQHLMYAQDGLIKVRQRFKCNQPSLPYIIKLSGQLVESFKTAKQINPTGERVTSIYNITVLIQWLINDIKQLNSQILRIDSSELSIALLLMKMVEKNQLLKALNARQTKQVNKHLQQVLQERLKEANTQCEGYSANIRDPTCRLISQNTRKSKESLLRKRESIIHENKPLAPLTQMDLNCVFSNILLNLRRTIKKANDYEEVFRSFRKELALMEIKSYFLSVATFTGTEKYVQQLARNIFNPQRKATYVHLIYDQKGLYKMYKYFQEAPLQQLQSDMRLLSKIMSKQSEIINK